MYAYTIQCDEECELTMALTLSDLGFLSTLKEERMHQINTKHKGIELNMFGNWKKCY